MCIRDRYSNLDILKEAKTPYPYIEKLNILLIRHGESEVNALQADYKSLGQPLTENLKIEDALVKLTSVGIEQANQLGITLKKYMQEQHISNNDVLILVSPYERARQTFEIANKHLGFIENAPNIVVLNSLIEMCIRDSLITGFAVFKFM